MFTQNDLVNWNRSHYNYTETPVKACSAHMYDRTQFISTVVSQVGAYCCRQLEELWGAYLKSYNGTDNSYPIGLFRSKKINSTMHAPPSAQAYNHILLPLQWDLSCDRAPLRSLIQTIYMAGFLTGCVVFGQISDK